MDRWNFHLFGVFCLQECYCYSSILKVICYSFTDEFCLILEAFLILLTLFSCLTTIVDRMTVDRIVREGLMVPDTGEACALGESFSHVLMGTRSSNRAPDLAMVIASGTSAICTQKKSLGG